MQDSTVLGKLLDEIESVLPELKDMCWNFNCPSYKHIKDEYNIKDIGMEDITMISQNQDKHKVLIKGPREAAHTTPTHFCSDDQKEVNNQFGAYLCKVCHDRFDGGHHKKTGQNRVLRYDPEQLRKFKEIILQSTKQIYTESDEKK